MIRLPIPSHRIAARVALTPAERHYLIDVLRLGASANVEVFDGEGGLFEARLDVEAGALDLGPRRLDAPRGALSLALAPALAKGDKLEWVIEKATELGADAFSPFSNAQCVVRLEGARAAARVERWQRIAAAAARQCGRAAIPSVAAPRSFEALLDDAGAQGQRVIVLWEREKKRGFVEALSEVAVPAAGARLLLVSGPEGGFREDEIERAREQGALTASLGKRILRAETAPIAALAVAQAFLGNLG